jgi:hypothetical protein
LSCTGRWALTVLHWAKGHTCTPALQQSSMHTYLHALLKEAC